MQSPPNARIVVAQSGGRSDDFIAGFFEKMMILVLWSVCPPSLPKKSLYSA